MNAFSIRAAVHATSSSSSRLVALKRLAASEAANAITKVESMRSARATFASSMPPHAALIDDLADS